MIERFPIDLHSGADGAEHDYRTSWACPKEENKLSEQDLRPTIWIGHVLLETDRLAETAEFMRKLGMRPIVERPEVAVLELRGGTHLVLIAKREVNAGKAPFDLMVEDLSETHKRFIELGLAPTAIER